MLNKIAKHQIENINQMNTQVVEKTTKITEQDNNVRELYIMTPEMVDAIRSKVEKNSKMPAMELEIEDLKLAHEFRRLFERTSNSVAASVNTSSGSPIHSQAMVSMTGEQEGPSELQMEFDIAPPSNTPIKNRPDNCEVDPFEKKETDVATCTYAIDVPDSTMDQPKQK